MSAVRLGRCILVLALALSAAFLASDVTASVREERARLPSVAEKQRDALRNSIERHPFDYLAFGERAALAEKSGEPDAIRFLNHALRLHPTHPSLHRLAARMLADRGYWNHAAVEYALAMRGASSPRSLLTEILDHAPDASSAAAAIAADHPDRGAVLRILGEADRDDVALAWLERIARTPPTAIADLDLLYETATRHSRLDLARFAAELRLRAENSSKSRLLLVRVLHGAKDHAELLRATSHLPSESGRHDDRLEMWLLRCDAFVATREWTSALECLHELERTGIPAALGDQGVRSRRKEIEREREAESRREALERLEMKPRTSAEP